MHCKSTIDFVTLIKILRGNNTFSRTSFIRPHPPPPSVLTLPLSSEHKDELQHWSDSCCQTNPHSKRARNIKWSAAVLAVATAWTGAIFMIHSIPFNIKNASYWLAEMAWTGFWRRIRLNKKRIIIMEEKNGMASVCISVANSRNSVLTVPSAQVWVNSFSENVLDKCLAFLFPTEEGNGGSL